MVDQYPQEFSAIETRARANGAAGDGFSDYCRDPRRHKVIGVLLDGVCQAAADALQALHPHSWLG
ncbi:hypothetical protein PJK45_24940 [Mycobacterium kansasii]|uniref:Uncharacterized protein n=2 Tax=Mycobacterium kansasii TaxID=1768 RepID=A0A1V3X4A0_MYCKA|nr:hypothetical protein [Mycobacterium kansasii]EUA07803.1 hypothetical protein I545_6326 [Mycobacterium kansasii 662]KEP41390.1 hypothetical protein MKSMC1_34580 [Mycobacterium kansasii]MXO38925.1 hypothetical protein [Mycobacterium kansasii]OOK64856.1 hypothetical protein BZL29_8087 [Mycobacterium kansasii]OOK73897.1 hypothetical protein BZL30_4441 [Mycobacterium kansasii]